MGYWRCKECGSKIVAYYGGTVDLDKNGYMIESTERDKSIDLYVCENGCDTKHTLEHIADWIEEDKKMKQQLMITLFEKREDTNHVLGCKSYEIENNKITNELVKSFIRKIEITSERIFGKLTTVMKYELINGFTGIESTAAVDEHNYSEEIGAKILIDKVRNQIWYGLGFALGMAQVKEEPTIVSNNKDIMSEKINFGRALEFIKEGKRAARYGWNGKNMYIYLVEGKTENGITYNPHFAIKNVNQSVSTWVPSVNDCLADDWYIY